MKIKIPNYLTIGRIIIVSFFVFAFYLPGFYGDIIPLVLFIIASFTDFLTQTEFEIQVLPPDIFLVEQLLIPEMNVPDWSMEKVYKIQTFFEKFLHQKSLTNSLNLKSKKRIYLSRKLAVKRHLTN